MTTLTHDDITYAQAEIAELNDLAKLTRLCLRLATDETTDEQLDIWADDLVRFSTRARRMQRTLDQMIAEDDARQAEHIEESESGAHLRGIL